MRLAIKKHIFFEMRLFLENIRKKLFHIFKNASSSFEKGICLSFFVILEQDRYCGKNFLMLENINIFFFYSPPLFLCFGYVMFCAKFIIQLKHGNISLLGFCFNHQKEK